MYYAKKYGLQTGDQIVEPLTALGLSKHFAVYLGLENGVEWIAENHKIYGVQVIPAYRYFQGVRQISRIDKFRGTLSQRRDLMRKAKSLVGTPYHLINYNCEHFATELTTGIAESAQINTAIILGLGISLYALFNKK